VRGGNEFIGRKTNERFFLTGRTPFDKYFLARKPHYNQNSTGGASRRLQATLRAACDGRRSPKTMADHLPSLYAWSALLLGPRMLQITIICVRIQGAQRTEFRKPVFFMCKFTQTGP